MDSCVYSGLRWLQASGIQDQSGAVYPEYRALTRSYGRASSAAGGLFIHALLQLGEEPGDDGVQIDPERVRQASKTARHLLENAFDLEADLFASEPAKPWKMADAFSESLIIRGLLALWRSTRDRAYLDCADRCGRSLQMRLSRVDGSYFPEFDLQERRAGDGEPGIEQLRIGLAFLELAEAAGIYELSAAARLTLDWALRGHEGVLADQRPTLLSLRRYAFFLEGLLPYVNERLDAGGAFQVGLLRLEETLRKRKPHDRPPELTAQILRLRLFADVLGLRELDWGRAEREAAELAEYQIQSPDPALDGGFAAEPHSAEISVTVRIAPSVLSLQALDMWEQARESGFRFTWRDLI